MMSVLPYSYNNSQQNPDIPRASSDSKPDGIAHQEPPAAAAAASARQSDPRESFPGDCRDGSAAAAYPATPQSPYLLTIKQPTLKTDHGRAGQPPAAAGAGAGAVAGAAGSSTVENTRLVNDNSTSFIFQTHPMHLHETLGIDTTSNNGGNRNSSGDSNKNSSGDSNRNRYSTRSTSQDMNKGRLSDIRKNQSDEAEVHTISCQDTTAAAADMVAKYGWEAFAAGAADEDEDVKVVNPSADAGQLADDKNQKKPRGRKKSFRNCLCCAVIYENC